ncbi:hypothetical protein E8E14_013710 [Neopestalotiopsis sp. 37M]|nr:hypothetical protein E8E14_013710 [Neopestalotiopsis sp. 37M]
MSGFLTGSNCLVILTLIMDEESTVANSMIVTHPEYGYKLPPGVLSVANRDMNDDLYLSSCRSRYLNGLIVQDDEIESEEDAESNEEDQEDEDTMSE